MARFQATNKVDLSFLGTGWEQAFVEVRVPTYGDIRELQKTEAKDDVAKADAMLAFVQKHFVSGKAPAGEVMVDLKSEDVPELPVTAFQSIVDTVVGRGVSPNSPQPSTEPSSGA